VISEKSLTVVQNITVTDGKGEQAAVGRCPYCGALVAQNGGERESLRA